MQKMTQTPQSLAQAPIPQADMDRKERMKDAWKAYHGEFGRPLKIKANDTDDNVISNRCEPIVNKGVSFLFGQEVKIECDDQDFVDGLWGDADDKMTLLSQLAINGGVCGQAFVKLIPAQGQMKYPRIVVMDPCLIRIITAPDDCSLTLAYIIEYPGTNDLQRRQIIARVDPDNQAGIAGEYDLDDTWTITNYVRKSQTSAWLQDGSSLDWPYPFAPIMTCQNLPNPNEAWGIPDLTQDLINQNKVLNFVQSNTSRIIKFHAHPKTYATGLSATQINIGVDDLICLPSPDSKLNTIEMRSDLHSSINFAAIIRSDMDEQSRVPAVALGRLVDLPKGNISGVALELLFQPLIEKTTQKQRLYGRLIREVTRAALVVAGKIEIAAMEDYEVHLHWQNLLPIDDLAAAQTAILLKQIGVSDATVMQQLGYDPDDEADKSAKEDAKKLVNFSRGQGMPPQAPAPGQPPAQSGQTPGVPGQQPGGQS